MRPLSLLVGLVVTASVAHARGEVDPKEAQTISKEICRKGVSFRPRRPRVTGPHPTDTCARVPRKARGTRPHAT